MTQCRGRYVAESSLNRGTRSHRRDAASRRPEVPRTRPAPVRLSLPPLGLIAFALATIAALATQITTMFAIPADRTPGAPPAPSR